MKSDYEHPIIVPLMLLAFGAAFTVFGSGEVLAGNWLSIITLVGGALMVGIAGLDLAKRWRRSRAGQFR